MKRKHIFIILISFGLVAAGYFLPMALDRLYSAQKYDVVPAVEINQAIKPKAETTADNANNITKSPKISNDVVKSVSVKVPFTAQAPTGNWNDSRFQDGCEEASIAMAMRWIQNKPFVSSADAEQEIFKIAKFEDKILGHHIDSSVEDVGRIFSELYGFDSYLIRNDVSLDSIKSELADGNIILVPAYGRALKNPNFTLPGPIAHMLVVVGYDPKTKEFIANDPGTKSGEGYRYGENLLLDAIWAYPSGKEHAPAPTSTAKKAMLVVNNE